MTQGGWEIQRRMEDRRRKKETFFLFALMLSQFFFTHTYSAVLLFLDAVQSWEEFWCNTQLELHIKLLSFIFQFPQQLIEKPSGH